MLRTTRVDVVTRARMRVVFVMAFVALVLGVLASSSRGLQLPPSLGNPLSDTEQLVNGVAGDLFSTLTGDLCSAANNLSSSAPGSGGSGSSTTSLTSLPGPGSTLLCELQFLQFDFHTVYKAPGGHQVVLDHFALPLVPTPIDISGDGIPDALATVYISSVNAVTLQITRLPTAPKSMPAEVELVIRDPSNPSSSERIAAGYDALSSNAPANFGATVSLLGIAPLQLGLNVKVTKPGSDLALVGSLYSQQPGGTKQVQADARLDYSPVPAKFGYNLLLASQHQHVTATASSASTVTASVSLVNGSDTQTINGTINKLPTRVDVDVINDSPTQRQATYTASAPIAHVDATYEDATQLSGGGNQINTQIVAHLTSLPKGVMFQQTAARVFSVTTSGGAIGSVDGGFATGEALTDVPGTASGAYVNANGGQLSAAVRLNGLQSANVDFSDPYKVDLISAKQPLSITDIDGESGRVVTGQVNDLPAHLTLTLDPDHGTISENGYGQGISSITAHLTATEPFAGPIARIGATLTGIPASFTLNYTHSAGAFAATIDNPIGEIDLTADDGTNSATVTGTDSGLGLLDTPTRFAAAVRVFGLQSLSYTSDPIEASLQSAPGHVWTLNGDVQLTAGGPEVTSTGEIDSLPSSVDVKLEPSSSGEEVHYTASAAITHIALAAASTQPLFLTASHFGVDLHGIPKEFDLTFSNANGSFEAQTDHTITEIDASANDGTHTVQVPGSDSGLGLIDKSGAFAFAVRVFGLQKVVYNDSPTSVEIDSAGGHVFAFAGTVEASGNPVTFNGSIDKLPSSVSAEVLPLPNGQTAVVYNASSAINELVADATSGTPLFAQITHLHADLTSIAGAFTLLAGYQNGQFTATIDHPVGEVQVEADSGSSAPGLPLYDENGNQIAAPTGDIVNAGDDGVGAYINSNGMHFGAQIYGLKSVTVNTSPLNVAVSSAGGHELYAAVHMESSAVPDLDAEAYVRDLPADFSFDEASSGTSGTDIKYTASDPITQMKVRLYTGPTPLLGTYAGLPSGATGLPNYLYGEIDGMPATEPGPPLEVFVPADGTPSVTFTNDSRTIGRLVFELLPDSQVPSGGNFFTQPLGLPVSHQSLPYSGTGAYNDGAQYDPNADGLYLRDNTYASQDSQGHPIPAPGGGYQQQMSGFAVAAAISGLRGGSFNAGPPMSAKLDVDPSLARPFGFDVSVDQGVHGDPEAPPPGAIVEGFIDSLPPNMSLGFSSDTANSDTFLNYSAGADAPNSTVSIPEMHLWGQNIGLPQMDLDIHNLPTKLNVCLGTGNAGAPACLRPIPNGYPPNSGDEVGEHKVTADFNDGGTSNGGPPMSVNGYICVTPDGSGNCNDPLPGFQWTPQDDPPSPFDFSTIPSVVKLDNLTFHNLFLDAFGTKCDGLEACAKVWVDTRGQQASGDVYYASPSISDGGWAGILMPSGFWADNRYIAFDAAGVDLVSGTVFDGETWDLGKAHCGNQYAFVGTHLHAGPLTVNINLANWLCNA